MIQPGPTNTFDTLAVQRRDDRFVNSAPRTPRANFLLKFIVGPTYSTWFESSHRAEQLYLYDLKSSEPNHTLHTGKTIFTNFSTFRRNLKFEEIRNCEKIKITGYYQTFLYTMQKEPHLYDDPNRQDN